MKKLLIYTLAAMAMVACSNDDVVLKTDKSAGSNVIAFSPAVPKSRGDETIISTIEKNGFWVRAVKADGTNLWNTKYGILKFTHNESTGYYTVDASNGDIDMTWPDEEVSFYAFSKDPNVNATYPDIREDSPVEWYFYQERNVPDQEDFVYATNKGTSDDFGSKAIPLEFKHPFVQVEVRALCKSADYDVRVKGYKIHYNVVSCPFSLPEPVTTGSFVTSRNSDEQPDGTWTSRYPNTLKGMYTVVNGGQDILSGFYGGYKTADRNTFTTSVSSSGSGTSVTIPVDNLFDYSHFIPLDEDDVQISNGEEGEGTNTAFLIPTHSAVPGYDAETGEGVYIALLVQVNSKKKEAIFPGMDETTGKRICYRGLPKYYGYIYVPIYFNWHESMGKKIVFTFDLTDGLGKVAPGLETVNPDTYDPENDNPNVELDDDKKGGDDPFSPNQDVIEKTMQFTVGVKKWVDITGSIVM